MDRKQRSIFPLPPLPPTQRNRTVATEDNADKNDKIHQQLWRYGWRLSLPVLVALLFYLLLVDSSKGSDQPNPYTSSTGLIKSNPHTAAALAIKTPPPLDADEAIIEDISISVHGKMIQVLKEMGDQDRKVWTEHMEDANRIKQKITLLEQELKTEQRNLKSRFTDQQRHIEAIEKDLWLELDRRQSLYEQNNEDEIRVLRESFQEEIEYAIEKFKSTNVILGRMEHDKEEMQFSKQALVEMLTNTLQDELDDPDVSLESIINKHIQTYHQDVINMADFALLSRGASVIYRWTSPTYSSIPAWKQAFFTMVRYPYNEENPPEAALTAATHAGECWSMAGTNGTLGISLSQPIRIRNITLEFPSKDIMHDEIFSAPKDVEILGAPHLSKARELVSLGKVKYDIDHKKNYTIQTFEINTERYVETRFYSVKLNILSNWGNPKYTNIYRVRIHGEPVKY